MSGLECWRFKHAAPLVLRRSLLLRILLSEVLLAPTVRVEPVRPPFKREPAELAAVQVIVLLADLGVETPSAIHASQPSDLSHVAVVN